MTLRSGGSSDCSLSVLPRPWHRSTSRRCGLRPGADADAFLNRSCRRCLFMGDGSEVLRADGAMHSCSGGRRASRDLGNTPGARLLGTVRRLPVGQQLPIWFNLLNQFRKQTVESGDSPKGPLGAQDLPHHVNLSLPSATQDDLILKWFSPRNEYYSGLCRWPVPWLAGPRES